MARLLLYARSVEELPAVDAILHDAGFSMAEVVHDDDRGIVTTPFHAPPRMYDFRLIRRPRSVATGEGPEGYVLEVSGVSAIEIRDPDGLVEHSYSHLRMQEDGRLGLVSNLPGGIDMNIAEIDVRVVA
jgi:hypothetical protein